MYRIIKSPDGTYRCEGMLQDGTETWTRPTLQEAVASMIAFADRQHKDRIDQSEIKFYREETQIVSKLVPYVP